MYGLAEQEGLAQRNGEDRPQGATDRPSKRAREDRRTRPYGVWDLSWELARYLDAEDFSGSASATPKTASGNQTTTRRKGNER